MSRCLSDPDLIRIMAELGTADERAHLARCVTCTGRYRGLTRDLDVIRRVLTTTPEAPARAGARGGRWVPIVAALSAVAVAGLLWIEVAVWRAIQPAPPAPEQIALALADVSAALFSVSGEPSRGLMQSPMLQLQQTDEMDTTCEGLESLTGERCRDALETLDEPELIDSSPLTGDSPEQGGEP